MDREAQQRIMGFFIEEARDHLVNLEQGLLSLQESATDKELINELFRAAHSIKGGAAMLGISSIQNTAHRMEDTFKVFRERNILADRKLESLLLRCYDTLAVLFDKLQSPAGLSSEDGEAAIAEIEPIFKQLELHVKVLLGEISAEAASAQLGAEVPSSTKKSPSLQDTFQQYVPRLLREMLDLFKQSDSAVTRARLWEVGLSLAQLGDSYQIPEWSTLCQVINSSLNNKSNQLAPMARQIIPALKQAQQQVLAGDSQAISISSGLAALAGSPSPSPDMVDSTGEMSELLTVDGSLGAAELSSLDETSALEISAPLELSEPAFASSPPAAAIEPAVQPQAELADLFGNEADSFTNEVAGRNKSDLFSETGGDLDNVEIPQPELWSEAEVSSVPESFMQGGSTELSDLFGQESEPIESALLGQTLSGDSGETIEDLFTDSFPLDQDSAQ